MSLNKYLESERYKKYLKDKVKNREFEAKKIRLRKILDKICPNKYDQKI